MLYFLLFIEGFIGLGYQVLFLRQVEPHVGSSSVTTGWVIGIFLLALSLGYRKGGESSLAPFQALGANFLKSAAVAGLGMSAMMLEFYFSSAMPLLGRIASLALYSVLIVGPVAYWMGQSLPLLVQRSSWGNGAAQLGGNALFLSTLGSMAGAIATSNLLLPYFGAAGTLVFISLLSALTGAMLCLPLLRWQEQRPNKRWALIGSTLLASVLGALINGITFLSVPSISTAYADMYVLEDEHSRYLISNQLTMSISDHQQKNQTWYINETAKLMDYHNIKDANIAVLGAGGFMLNGADKHNNQYIYVDIDGKIQDFVAENFNAEAAIMPFEAKDARAYLIETEQRHDVIYLDTFSSRHALPRHLLTQEFFSLIAKRLKPDGLLLVNAILDPSFNDPYSRNFHSTLLRAFPYCMANTMSSGGVVQNVIYHCRNRQEKPVIYTDDRNTAEKDSVEAMGR